MFFPDVKIPREKLDLEKEVVEGKLVAFED